MINIKNSLNNWFSIDRHNAGDPVVALAGVQWL
jgi:hypothetical protein